MAKDQTDSGSKKPDGDSQPERVEKPAGGQAYKASPKKVTVVFRGNRKFMLRVGREYFDFGPMEAKQMDPSVLQHPDFVQVARYFTVKGV